MQSSLLQKALLDFSASSQATIGFRRIIDLAGIGDCDRLVYGRYLATPAGDPRSKSDRIKARFYQECRAALIDRIDEMGLYIPLPPVLLYGGLVQGHPDGTVGGDLLMVRTVRLSVHLPQPPRLPSRTFFEVQALMHFTGLALAHVIYLARANGDMQVIGTNYNPRIGARIVQRIDNLVVCAHTGKLPACSCDGRCQNRMEQSAREVNYVTSAA